VVGVSEWPVLELGSLITYKKGFAFKSSSYHKDGEIFIVRVSDTTDSSINIESCMKIETHEALLLDEYKLLTDDIIVATVGSWADNPNSIVGKVIKVPEIANGALLNQNAVRLRSNNIANQNYLYYKLRDNDFSGYLLGNAQGSANQASITLKDIFSYQIKLPLIPEQKAIAAVLSSLDDKM
jgi:type I restriction enzyme S subunit